MPADQASGNKASFRRFCDVINTRDAELISKMIDEVVDADAVIRTPIPVEATGRNLPSRYLRRSSRRSPTSTSRSRT
jgi:hypothetical protein